MTREYEVLKPKDDQYWKMVLPQRLAGEVVHDPRAGWLTIKSLVPFLPLSDGKQVNLFNANQFPLGIKQGDLVTFAWQYAGDVMGPKPRAADVLLVPDKEEEQVRRQAADLQDRLANDLRSHYTNLVNTYTEMIETEQARVDRAIAAERAQLEADYQARKTRHALLEADLVADKQTVTQDMRWVEAESARLEKAEAQLARYRRFLPDLETQAERPPIPAVEVAHLVDKWPEMLTSKRVSVPPYISRTFLLSLLTSAYAGSMVLLNGSVGVGKSSLVERAAGLLGGVSTMIPVRPSWMDPADLLGYFDPIHDTFRPTPFLTAMQSKALEPLHLLCLDELNLARVENYAADLLSRLEYSAARGDVRPGDSGAGLQLYAESIYHDLLEEAAALEERSAELDPKTQARLQRLRSLFRRYPAGGAPVPANVVMLGTLNSDATTYELSPKVVDRSFVISVPSPDSFAPLISPHQVPNCVLPSGHIRRMVEEHRVDVERGEQVLTRWNEKCLKLQLGIPLGHRAMEHYRVFAAIGRWLDVPEADVFGSFVYAKILPRISFAKDEQGDREERFQEWLDHDLLPAMPFDPGDTVDWFNQQLDDDGRRHVRYWRDAL